MSWRDWIIKKLNGATRDDIELIVDAKFGQTINTYLGHGTPVPIDDNKESYITNGYNKNLFVYAVVKYIAQKASVIPWQLMRKLPNGESEQVLEHPLLDLIYQPNPLVDWTDHVEQTLGFMLITGDSYNYKSKPITGENKGKTTRIYTLPAQYMEIVSESNTKPIDYYQVNYNPSTLGSEKYEVEEILHIKLPNYEWKNGSNLYGMSPIKAGLMALTASNSNMQAIDNNNKNQGAVGILMPAENQSFSEPQMRTLENMVRKKVSGKENQGRYAYTNTRLTWQQLGANAKDMELINQHNLSRSDICTMLNVNPLLFGETTSSTFNNMDTARKAAYVDAILPALNKYQSEFNRNIIDVEYPNEGLYFQPDTSGIEVLQDDMKEKAAWLKDAYWITTQEKQRMSKVDVDESAPRYFIPTNLVGSDAGIVEPDGNTE